MDYRKLPTNYPPMKGGEGGRRGRGGEGGGEGEREGGGRGRGRGKGREENITKPY